MNYLVRYRTKYSWGDRRTSAGRKCWRRRCLSSGSTGFADTTLQDLERATRCEQVGLYTEFREKDGAISEVVAPTRIPLAPQNRLVNLVNLRLDELAPRVKSWNVDAFICALRTTKARAGSQEALRYVDYTLPLVFAKAAHAAGAETFALVSAIGAATNSMFFYAGTKGEVE